MEAENLPLLIDLFEYERTIQLVDFQGVSKVGLGLTAIAFGFVRFALALVVEGGEGFAQLLKMLKAQKSLNILGSLGRAA